MISEREEIGKRDNPLWRGKSVFCVVGLRQNCLGRLEVKLEDAPVLVGFIATCSV